MIFKTRFSLLFQSTSFNKGNSDKLLSDRELIDQIENLSITMDNIALKKKNESIEISLINY